jgi:hypothetical protein
MPLLTTAYQQPSAVQVSMQILCYALACPAPSAASLALLHSRAQRASLLMY